MGGRNHDRPFVLSPTALAFGVPRTMAPRANWKGFLPLSLVTCPVALYPATSESEKISFNQLNKATGHRIKYLKVDAETGEAVPNDDIVKGYMLDKDVFMEVSKEELEDIALSRRAPSISTSSSTRPRSTRATLSDPTTCGPTARSATTLSQ